MFRGQSDAWCGTASPHTLLHQNDLVHLNCHLPYQGQAPLHMPGAQTLLCQVHAHVFFSSVLTFSQQCREQRQLYISLSSHTHVSLPPQQQGYSGAKTMHGPSLTNTFTQTLHGGSIFASPRLVGRRDVGRTAEKKYSPHHHTMS